MKPSAAALLALVAAFSTIAASPATAPSPATPYDLAFLSGDTQTIWDHSSPALQKDLESPAKLKSSRASSLGEPPAAGAIKPTPARGAQTLVRPPTTAGGRALDITWTIEAKSATILG